PEALGPVAADQQVLVRLPLEAGLAVGGAAEVAVVRVPAREADLKQVGTGDVGQDREQELAVHLVEVICTGGWLAAVARAQARSHEGVGRVEATFAARLKADGEAGHAALQLE